MLEFTWPYSVRMLPKTKTCKLFCIFCGQKPPSPCDVITSRPFTSYLLQISEDISAHRNCLTCATDLEVESDDSYSIPAIEKVIENAVTVNCEFCEKPGATVRTQENLSYHVPCLPPSTFDNVLRVKMEEFKRKGKSTKLMVAPFKSNDDSKLSDFLDKTSKASKSRNRPTLTTRQISTESPPLQPQSKQLLRSPGKENSVRLRSRSGERKQFSSPKGNHVSQEVRTKKRPLSDKHCEQKKPSPPKKRPSVEFQDANVSKILDFAENEAAVNTVIFSPVKQTKSSKCSSKSSKVKEAHCDPEESSESEGLSPELRHDKQPVEITKATGKKFRSCKATKLVPFDAALSIPKEVAKKKKKKIVPKESSKSTASKIKKVIVTPVDLSERTFYTMDRIQPMTEGIVDDEVGCNDWFRDLAHRQINDFLDVNEGEKEFFKMWNDHLTESPCLGDLHMEITVTKFIDNFGEQIYKKSLYRNFVLHVVNLSEFNLLTRPAVFTAICRLQNVFASMPELERPKPSTSKHPEINEVSSDAHGRNIELDDDEDSEESGDEVTSGDDSSEVNFCLHLSDDDDVVVVGSDDDVIVLESSDEEVVAVVAVDDDSDVMSYEKSESGSSASSDSSPPARNNNNNINVIKKNATLPVKANRFRQFVASQTTFRPPVNPVVNQNDSAATRLREKLISIPRDFVRPHRTCTSPTTSDEVTKQNLSRTFDTRRRKDDQKPPQP